MRIYVNYFVLTLFLTESIVQTCYAALVERDWLVTGDGAITWDTATGLEWLDLTETAGLSFNQVNAQLGVGNTYENFSYATDEQIRGLFAAVGLKEFDGGLSDQGPKVEYLLNFWGVLLNLGTGERSEYLTGMTAGLPLAQHWSGRVYWLSDNQAAVNVLLFANDDDYGNITIGSALIRHASNVTVDGDVNEDGQVNVADLVIVQQIVLGLSAPPGTEPGHADFYPPTAPDGIINASDLLLMYQLLLK
ncbi:MAG: dockerin type I repeat-containing protein [Gammaproteobacteria bacterium]|nr:dockerin type I repeat-containing protein [Gammaproteobacteria bacterium]